MVGLMTWGEKMKLSEHSNVLLLKEIAELLNEETDMERMLKGAIWKLLRGSNFETAWIFSLMKTASTG